MSNIPMHASCLMPPNWAAQNKTMIVYKDSLMSIHENGDICLDGSAKTMAMGLLKYIIEEQWSPGMTSFELNHALRIECEDNQFTLHYVKENRPEFFDELTKDFNRLVKMKAFW